MLVEIDSGSDKAANSDKHGTLGTDASQAEHALLKSQDRLIFEVIVLLNFSVDEVCSEALNGVVELVFPEVSPRISHEKVWPASILLPMDVLKLLDISESILQDCSVEKGV